MLLQFAQRPPGVLPTFDLKAAAERYFDARLSVLSESQTDAQTHATLTFDCDRFGIIQCAALARAAVAADYDQLAAAERANQSYGMADLGRRCPSAWEVRPDASASPAARFYLGALLACVALGPLLVPGYPGLFGVRSARLKSQSLEVGE